VKSTEVAPALDSWQCANEVIFSREIQSVFHISAGIGGTVEIVDPPAAAQQLDFNVPPLLGYLENVVDTSWMIADDVLTGKIALLCNYIAAGFPSAEDGHALTVPSETAHSTSPQLTLTAPHTK
jgi:hypothetical protein